MAELFMDHWVKWILGVIFGSLGLLSRRIKKELEEQKLLKSAMLALMHDRLYQLCNEHITNKQISTSALRNIGYIYRSYHALGGNGTGTELYERVKKLPIKNEGGEL